MPSVVGRFASRDPSYYLRKSFAMQILSVEFMCPVSVLPNQGALPPTS